jgi:hypothetical protein
MSLNKGGDTIELLNAMGRVIQTISYGSAGENEVIRP